MSMSTIGVPLEGFGAYCRAAAAEGAVLLKNEGHMLPLKKEEMVSVFGRCQFETYRSGTGSGGAVNVPYAVNIYDGMRESGSFTLNEELADIYRAWLKDHPFDNGGGGWAAEPWHQKEMVITEEIAAATAEKSEERTNSPIPVRTSDGMENGGGTERQTGRTAGTGFGKSEAGTSDSGAAS